MRTEQEMLDLVLKTAREDENICLLYTSDAADEL